MLYIFWHDCWKILEQNGEKEPIIYDVQIVYNIYTGEGPYSLKTPIAVRR